MVKTFIAKAERFISEGNRLAAEEAVRQAISALDRAAQRRVIHPNNAARRKSRLMRKFNQVFRETAAIASEPGAAR
jgi:small subunit ribosomal protein S20